MADAGDLLLLGIATVLAIGYTLDMVMLGAVLVWVSVYILLMLIDINDNIKRGGVQ